MCIRDRGLLSNVSDGAAVPIYHLGVDALFHQMILSHEVGLLKPDPAIFRLACERLGVPPEETAFVADGGFSELDAAFDMGIYSIQVVQENQSPDLSLIHISEPTRRTPISYAVFCLKKK